MTQTPVRQRAQALALLALAPTLALVAPSPSTAWALLTHPHGTGLTAATAPLTAALALAAWACTGWLLLVLAATFGTRLPGALGRASQALVGRLAPASVRSLVRVALGTSVVVSVLTGTSSAFADPAPSYDWPGVSVVTATPATPRAHATPAPSTSWGVVVQPGDSLWAIAARDLGPRATATQVAQAWPRWWSANRTVIGDDPDLVHPGTRLSAPPAA